MSVASHLGIRLDEYDARIRTFVPHYERMIDAVAATLDLLAGEAPAVVDLGIGTGALAMRCLAVRPGARLVGIDGDPGMLAAARVRLAGHDAVELIQGDFLDFELPACDAIVASIALHHVRTAERKRAFLGACGAALREGGVLIVADCFPAREPRLARRQHEAWLDHLTQSYSRDEAESYLRAWAGEDVYFPLDDELSWMRDAGLATEVVFREDGFAVIAGVRSGARA